MFVPAVADDRGAAGAPALPADIFSIQSAIYGRYHLINPQNVLRGQQRLAALADRRRRPAVPGAPGREHLQQPGPAGLDHSGSHVAAVPGVFAARHVRSSRLHRVGRLRPGLTVDALGQQPELQPDGLDGGTCPIPAHYGQLNLYEVPAGDDWAPPTRTPRSRPTRRCRRRSRCWTRGLAGAAGRDADGPDRATPWCTCDRCTPRRRRTPSPSWHTWSRCSARTSASRRPVGRALRRAADDGDRAAGVGRDVDGHRAGGGGGHLADGADRLHQRAGCVDGGQPRAVPDGHRGNGRRSRRRSRSSGRRRRARRPAPRRRPRRRSRTKTKSKSGQPESSTRLDVVDVVDDRSTSTTASTQPSGGGTTTSTTAPSSASQA